MIALAPLPLNDTGLYHASMVIWFVGFKFGAFCTSTKSSTPSKLNACPTLPATNVAPFCRTPLLASSISFAFPSPGHQLIIFGGGGVHVLHLPALPAL